MKAHIIIAILVATHLQHSKAFGENKPSFRIDHEIRDIEGWKVHVDKALLDENDPKKEGTALKTLRGKLHRISLIMPQKILQDLKKVQIFLDKEHKLVVMQYHQGKTWLRRNGYDQAMAKAVHIPRANVLIHHEKTQGQQWPLLHELAHAYHDQFLGLGHSGIKKAYENAKKSGKYNGVLHMSGKKVQHYAMTNYKEYFAEATEAYFGANDFYPFVRPQLKLHDPECYIVLQSIWGKR